VLPFRIGPPESPKQLPPPCAGLAVTRTNSSLWVNEPETSRAGAISRISSPAHTGGAADEDPLLDSVADEGDRCLARQLVGQARRWELGAYSLTTLVGTRSVSTMPMSR
jgi:hypothetical protein